MKRDRNRSACEPPPWDVLDAANRYYSEKLRTYGPTPKGVDWNGAESQNRRFEQLVSLFRECRSFSLNDIGCGYGALLEFLASRGHDIDYRGYDISNDMVQTARSRHPARRNAVFSRGSRPNEAADYSVASGIFNVKAGANDADWLQYMHGALDEMNRFSIRGFAFNCLSTYSDADRRRADLYYADPRHLFHRCMTRYARNVGLLHDYGLHEFTILVRKNEESIS